MKNLKFLLLGVLMFFVGCGGVNHMNVSKNMQANIITDPHVKFDDSSLFKWLKFEFINYIQRQDGLIEFEAVFKNNSKINKLLSYKIIWKDENGFTQKTIMSKWTKASIESGRFLNIHAISPSIKSKDFEIIIQEPTKDDNKRNDSYHKQYSN
ncbi:DUF1425 domain-containing protein [Campylobacter sp. FMV-PI01]|uniref:DUF1425 domain-containing protein n=1 Tax=Campylobacter portucalensis TaxID=2608384 RepID=A0A6L5WI58_9BACT|nr:YcfL family protein [Campylobacter portucalensis]MSN96152.1 DUF1425 domain-containing protein [Campylobacter portucalensis]